MKVTARFPEGSPELEYLHARRKALGGYLPRRRQKSTGLEVPPLSAFAAQLAATGDRVDLYGVGFGRFLGDDIRIGLDLNNVRRVSTIPSREYEGFRFGVSISYGS